MLYDLLGCFASAVAVAVGKALVHRLVSRLFERERSPRVCRLRLGRWVLTVTLAKEDRP